jgi:hypothetical protein
MEEESNNEEDHTMQTDDASAKSDATPIRNKKGQGQTKKPSTFPNLPDRDHVLRYDFKICVPETGPGERSDKILHEALSSFIEKLLEEDSTAYVGPWRANEKDAPPPIFRAADIPSKMGALKKYFPRANPIRNGGHVYVPVLIGHTVPLPEIKENIEWWLKEWTHGMWLRPLQCEDTTVLGWLLYSLLSMDLVSLAEVISSWLGVPVGLRFRMISLGTAGKVPENNIVKAIHVEVDKKHAHAARRKLQDIYGTSQTVFPNGIMMRLLPCLNSPDLNLKTRSKVERLRERQGRFAKNIVQIRTWDISQLDFHDRFIDASLRDLIMQIPAPTLKKLTMFHHMDRHWKDDGIVVSILPQYEAEARSMLMSMLTFLRHKLKDKENVPRLEKFFTATAVERAAEAVWDEEEGCAITPDDRHVEAMFENDEEYDLSGGDTEKATNGETVITDLTPPERPDPSTLNTTLYGDDKDSVSTFGTMGKQTGYQPPVRRKKPEASHHLKPVTSTVRMDRPKTPPSSTPSVHTAVASESPSSLSVMSARMDRLENGLENLSGLSSQLKQLLDAGPLFNPAGSNGAAGAVT